MQPVAGATVEIQINGQTVASTTTDGTGVFAVRGLRGGVHQIVTPDSIENCRLWSHGTPPTACGSSPGKAMPSAASTAPPQGMDL